ncbi:hypothetical protein [Paenibacillus harenae]|uniref:DUF3221 domain-containing protein n=1 Tax=Paenibacillus harenae TaxID=306543 RepID=A0ABT9U5K2_PAEHA|nr:hypothetical protein [Paenibacillus harenae]MDQ0113684.1 hypothetical protein [Paenibacillus harenae]
MKKFLLPTIFVVTLIFAVGCSNADRNAATYKVNGDIDVVEKTGGTVEGVKSEYIVKLTDMQQESESNKSVAANGTLSITKNTSIYKQSGDKKEKTDISAIEKGKSAEIIWRFANDHLTEAVEINIK